MNRYILLPASFVMALISAAASAQTTEQIKRYDFNGNKKIDEGREMQIYLLHKSNPSLAAFDLNNDGEINALDLKEQRRRASQTTPDAGVLADIGFLQDEAARSGGIPINKLASDKPAAPKGCDPQQGFYVRHDPLDVAVYNQSIKKSGAKGASFSWTDDQLAHTQTAEIHGFAAAVIARDPCLRRPKQADRNDAYVSGYAFAPWASANGKLSTVKSADKSALKTGLDAQVEVFDGPLFDSQYFTFSPYYQTDFRGQASAYGASGSWQPYWLDVKLGGSYQQLSSLLDFYWQLKAEVDSLHVERVGLTDLTANTNYVWIGGTIVGNLFPFPDLFDSRLSVIGTFHYYWDAQSGRDIHFTSVAAAYNITEDGSTSLSVEYQRGTDKATLQRRNQYLTSLNYKF